PRRSAVEDPDVGGGMSICAYAGDSGEWCNVGLFECRPTRGKAWRAPAGRRLKTPTWTVG
ncbi:hypothetical protein, partial [Limnohabitans planktonicus]|uniref:hypothetical protein n=1 Tax=Limnohabitans planktonicus TaxID=540060 RepID=UPI00197B5966